MTHAQNQLRPFVETLNVRDPIGHRNLTLVPLRGGRRGVLDYHLSGEAFAAGTLTVTEVSEGGSVPELLAVTQGEKMVLLLDGEELRGAKQNRILNTTVLLPAKARTKIPVSCVEQGRWRHVSHEFSAGDYSPARLRAVKSHHVTQNLEACGVAASDQRAVWDEVASSARSVQACSPTMAMSDSIEQRRDSLDAYVLALAYPADSRGVIVAINGRFVAMDLFDKPATLAKVWSRLLTGYALDALGQGEGKTNGQFTSKGAQTLLDHAADLDCRAFPTVGVGEDWRFEAPDVVGQALVAEGDCAHLCIFPTDAIDDRGGRHVNEARIAPPSRRRGHRPPPDEIVY